jgi:UDP-hydrolysing UDP-N-acetyl-D-glucosamine 2-epimerase
MRRRVAVLTTGRQDYGILRSTLLLLRDDAEVELLLVAAGMCLSEEHGMPVREIERDGFSVAKRIAWRADAYSSPAAQMAQMITGISDFIAEREPEYLVVVGDRYETAAAALAATISRVPLVHLHGGEESEGAFDNQLRHAITKMAHLHLVSHPVHAARIIQMGEEPNSVHVVGAAGCDNFLRDDLAGRDELERCIGLALVPPVIVVTLHPATLSSVRASSEVDAVVEAMRQVEATYVVTLPNSDPGNAAIRERFLEMGRSWPRMAITPGLGTRYYCSLMRIADALLGNSSSALIEAPFVGTPAVNVGDRQQGRLRSANVIDAAAESSAIIIALRKALSPPFQSSALSSRVERGRTAAAAITAVLRNWNPPSPPRKRFFDAPEMVCSANS